MKSKFTELSIAKQNESKTVRFFTNKKSGLTVCRLYDRWEDRHFTAQTHCLDVDKYSEKKGRAIAFNKARRKELVTNIKELNEEYACIKEYYETILNNVAKRIHIKKIYLAGVEDELRELMNTDKLPKADEPAEEYNPATLGQEEPAPVQAEVEEVPVLKQFSNLKED